jgi:ArsR family transcriptional regulator
VVARKQGVTTYYRIRPGDPLLEGPVGGELKRRAVELGLLPRVERIVARRRAKAEAFFDEQAESWDALRDQLLDKAAGLSALVPLIPRAERVADIGTGTGGMLPLLAEFAEHIVAVDISKEMLRHARQRAKALGLGNVEFVKADLHDLPLEDASVEAAFATLVLHHAPDPAAAVREMARILRPGGALVVVDLSAHGHEWLREEQGDIWLGFTRDELAGYLANAGLVRVKVKVVSQVDTGKKGGGHPLKLFVASGTVPLDNRREN